MVLDFEEAHRLVCARRFQSPPVSIASSRLGDDTGECRSRCVGTLRAAHNPRHRKAAASSARSGDRKAIRDYVVIMLYD